MNSKQRCLNQLQGKPVDRVPVFPLLMSFAAQRIGISYKQYASEGSALAASQVNIFKKFNVDAITACSDAFRVSADLGGRIIFPDQHPPYIAEPLVKDESDLHSLKRPDVSDPKMRMYDRAVAIKQMAGEVGDECLILGWVDMPFAEACSICGVGEFMMMLYENPKLAHNLLDFLTDIVIDFGLLQASSGAPMIGAGDAAASLISPQMYRDFALPYEQRVCDALHKNDTLVKLHICGNTSAIINDMIDSGADLFNVDHLVDFHMACHKYSAASKAFKGNLDPVAHILQSDVETCGQNAREHIKQANGSRYFLSAGCEIPAAVSDEVFAEFCNSVL